MMPFVRAVLMALALTCFFFAALEWKARHGNLLAAGLFLWLLAILLEGR